MEEALQSYSQDLPPRQDSKCPPASDHQTVVVIGSTGYLGPYIVAALLKTPSTAEVICLNRNDDRGERTRQALSNIGLVQAAYLDRLRFLKADLAQPDFGLNSRLTAGLSNNVDQLVFNAWDSNWGKSLDHFYIFLKGVRSSIDFSLAADKHVCITLISSICAVGDWAFSNPAQPNIPEDIVWDNRSAMPHGYGESKCVAEQLLGLASKVSGLSVNIVRAGQIGGPLGPAAGTWPRQGWLYSIIDASKRIGYFPNNVQPLDWIPVDTLAEGVATCSRTTPSCNTVRVFNMVHPQPAAWSVLYHALRKYHHLRAGLIDLPDWLARLDPNKVRLYGFLEASQGGREHNMTFSNTNAVQVLPPTAKITPELLFSWLKDWGLSSDTCKARM